MNIGEIQIPNFGATLAQGQQAQTSRLQQLAMMQEMADQEGLRAAAATPGLMDGSNPDAVAGLMRYGQRGVQLANSISQRADQQRGQIREQLPMIAGLLEGATPETWGDVRGQALAAGLSPSLLPEAFDQNRVAGLVRAARATRDARISEQVAEQNALLPGRLQVAQAGRTNVNVRLPPMENSFAQETGKTLAEEAGQLHAAGQRGNDTLRQVQRFETALERFNSGAGANARLTIGQIVQQLGIPDDALPRGINRGAVASAEDMRALTGQMLASMIGPGGFPAQNFSNADREMLERALPNIANTPDGNRILLQAARAGAQRNVEVAQAWRQWQQQNGVSADSFLRFQRERLPQIAGRDIIAPLMPAPQQSAPGAGIPGPGNRGTAEPPAAAGSLPRVRTPAEAQQLPRGTRFIDPNGVERVVP